MVPMEPVCYKIRKELRLLYTPLDGSYGDMAITLNVDASKTAGQGFGSATGQIWICISSLIPVL